MTGFNLALSAAAEMLAKLTHLDRMPGGGGALDGLRIEIDGPDQALSITWAKPDVARKAAAYGAELREAIKAAANSADPNMPLAVGDAPLPAALSDLAVYSVRTTSDGPSVGMRLDGSDNSPPPAPAPPPCDGPDESDPPPPCHGAAEGTASVDDLPSVGITFTATSACGEHSTTWTRTVDLDGCRDVFTSTSASDQESSGEDLSRVPPEPLENAFPPADSNRGRVLAAWREGCRDVATIARQSGLAPQQVIMALKGLRSLGLVPKASRDPLGRAPRLRNAGRGGASCSRGSPAGRRLWLGSDRPRVRLQICRRRSSDGEPPQGQERGGDRRGEPGAQADSKWV